MEIMERSCTDGKTPTRPIYWFLKKNALNIGCRVCFYVPSVHDSKRVYLRGSIDDERLQSRFVFAGRYCSSFESKSVVRYETDLIIQASPTLSVSIGYMPKWNGTISTCR